MIQNPFRGPTPLGENDGIFGRDREITEVVDRLIANRAVLLYSPARAGRTSLIEAGLKPRLAAEKIEYRSVSATDSFDSLPDSDGEQVLIFDRFEEVLTSGQRNAAGEKERREIFWRLGRLLRTRHNVMAIFSLREDFAGPLDHYLRWFPELISSRVRLGLLTTANARKAIEEPLRAAGFTVDQNVTDRLLEGLARGEPWADREDDWVEPLLLQVVCSRLYAEPGNGPSITAETLAALKPGIFDPESALEDYYSQAVREAAGKSGTAERVIRGWFDNPQSSELPRAASDALQEKQLIEAGSATTIAAPFIEPIRNSNRASKDVLQRDAEAWHATPSTDRLLRGERLRKAKRWAHAHAGALLDFERDFLRESKRALSRRIAMRAVAAGCVAASLAIAVISLRARAASRAFLVGQLTRDIIHEVPQQPDSAALLALNAEQQSKGNVLDALFAPDIQAQANASVNEAFLAVTMHDPFYVRAFQQSEPGAGCVWLDNGTLYTAAGSSDIRVVNQSARTIAKVPGANVRPPERCGDAVASRNQRIDLPAGWKHSETSGPIQLTDSSGHVYKTVIPGTALRVAVGPGSHDLIAWTIEGENYVYVASMSNPNMPKVSFSSGDFEPMCIRFAPDGITLAEGGRDKNIRLWSLPGVWDPHPKWDTKILRAHTDTVLDLEFDATGRELYSTGADGRLVEWHRTEYKAPDNFTSFVPDLVTAQVERVAGQISHRVTIRNRDGSVQAIENAQKGFGLVAVSKAGVALVSFASGELSAVNFNRPTLQFSPATDQAFSQIAISPDGKWAGAAVNDFSHRQSLILRWKVSDLFAAKVGQTLASARSSLPSGAYVSSLAFSADGSILASGDDNNRIQFWDAAGKPAGAIATGQTPEALAFGPKLLASINESRNLQFWDVKSRVQVGATMPLRGSSADPVTPIAFTQNGDALDIMTANGIVSIPIESAKFHDAVLNLVPPGFHP
jgi:WD40 repeat protein